MTRFETERLLIAEWHTLQKEQWPSLDLAGAVQEILTPSVTACLPSSWQGKYSRERADQWIHDRDGEDATWLVVEKTAQEAVGLLILSGTDEYGHLRLGYLLKESAWGNGYASELVSGLVDWCRENRIRSLTGGVVKTNTASARVLEKCGFKPGPDNAADNEQMYSIEFV